ncbi:MAG: class I adenylate-forming enzyme family protein [Xanthobacteraceae bacterium]
MGFTNLGDLIPRERDLSKVALIDLGGEQSPREFTFAAIDEMANGVARALGRRGLHRGDRVALLSANRAEYLAAYYGIMRAGFVAVPVNFKFPRETIHFIMRDAGAKLVFCDSARAADCPLDLPVVCFDSSLRAQRSNPEPQSGLLRRFAPRNDAMAFETFLDPGPFAAIVPAPDEPAMFLYTSGSTGTPKGVVLSHQSHIWVVETRLAPGLDRHRYLIAAPLYHMNALALAKLACAAHATILLLPQFDARAYMAAIGQYRCTWLTAVPPMIAMMLRERDLMARTDLSSVEFVRMGSAPVSSSLMAALHAALPRAAVTNAYGTTEAGPVVFGPHPRGLPQPELSVGYPHPKVALRLVDGENRDAEQGVLEMKCPAMMLGYHNRPDVAPPITPDGFYITGDVFGRDADGFHYFVGRTDDMFVSGGENIYPADVERMLERHPDIAQAAVVPIEDDIKGQKPVAFVIRKPGRALDDESVKRFALKHAPAYQHPRFVWFVDELPLASTNKLDRAALMRMAAERMGNISPLPGGERSSER